MKSLKEILIESSVLEGQNRKLYHVSREKISSLKDFPMFFYEDINESNALVDNFKSEGTDAFQYECQLSSNVYLPTIEELTELLKNKSDINKLEDYEGDLVTNPDEKELLEWTADIERLLKKNGVEADGITLNDYSQIDYNNDAFSILIFHPGNVVKNFKLIR